MATWQSGSLGDLQVQVSPSATAMTAFYNETGVGQSSSGTATMRLYYGARDNLVHEVVFNTSSSTWFSTEFAFPESNGNAGLASTWYNGAIFDDQSPANLFILNKTNQLEKWNLDVNGTKKHPYGVWKKGQSVLWLLATHWSKLTMSQIPSTTISGLSLQTPR